VAAGKISVERLRRIQERQGTPAWGKSYVPAIHATPKEAPSISRASVLYPEKLGFREMHLLSLAEQSVAILALYNHNVWDIHEQKVLSPLPCANPMHGHPRALGMTLPHAIGTIEIADRIGILKSHPKVKVIDATTGKCQWVPFPFIGDLLLFLEDDAGPYLVNWNVKDRPVSFRRRLSRYGKPVQDIDDAGAIARHKLENDYYLSAGIRTVQLASIEIDFHVRCNLRELFTAQAALTRLSRDIETEAEAIFNESVGRPQVAAAVVLSVMTRLKIAREAALAVLKRAVWHRRIMVDLFTPFLMDRPLQPQTRDVLDVYSEWFRR